MRASSHTSTAVRGYTLFGVQWGMAFEAVVELFGWATGAGVRTKWSWFRRATAAEILGSLDQDGRAAFLELLVCATLDDGQISDAELAMLLRRTDNVGKREVQTALDVAHDARPFYSQDEYAAFVTTRADRLPNAKMRVGAFAACMAILTEANALDLNVKATLYGQALGVPEAERARIQRDAAGGLSQG